MIPPIPQQNFAGPYGPMGYGPPMMSPYQYSPTMGMGMGYGAPIPPTGLSTSRTQITTTTSNIMNPMINQAFTTSNVGPMMMGGYETAAMNAMGGYGATMVNSMVVPPVPPIGVGCAVPTATMTTVNSNSRVIVGNSNSRVIIAPPIYNKAVFQHRPVETRVEYIPYETREIVYDTVEKREMIPIQKTIT